MRQRHLTLADGWRSVSVRAFYGFILSLTVATTGWIVLSALWPAGEDRYEFIFTVAFLLALFGGPLVGIAMKLPFWPPSRAELILGNLGGVVVLVLWISTALSAAWFLWGQVD